MTAHPPRDGTLVAALVTRARTGDKQAWDALAERYAPLIRSVCGRYRLSRADAEDVGQGVWLHLAGQLDKIRDPAAARSATRRSQPLAAVRPAADRLAHR